MRTLKKEWDRIAIYALLLAFGVHTIIFPLTSVQDHSPSWAEWTLGIQFGAAGIMLMVGLSRPTFRMGGLVATSVGLATISLLVGVTGSDRALGVAFLFGAFALQAVHDIRNERVLRAEEKALRREVHQLLDERESR